MATPDLLAFMNGFYPYRNEYGEYHHKHDSGPMTLKEAKHAFQTEIIEGTDDLYDVQENESSEYKYFLVDSEKLRRLCEINMWDITAVLTAVENNIELVLSPILMPM